MDTGRSLRRGLQVGVLPSRARVAGERHDWLSALYVNWDATRRLVLLGELWTLGFAPAEADFGASAGIDYGVFGDALRVLFALSTGIVSLGGSRLEVRAYLGTQYTFGK